MALALTAWLQGVEIRFDHNGVREPRQGTCPGDGAELLEAIWVIAEAGDCAGQRIDDTWRHQQPRLPVADRLRHGANGGVDVGRVGDAPDKCCLLSEARRRVCGGVRPGRFQPKATVSRSAKRMPAWSSAAWIARRGKELSFLTRENRPSAAANIT
jgi:hypothetical protein